MYMRPAYDYVDSIKVVFIPKMLCFTKRSITSWQLHVQSTTLKLWLKTKSPHRDAESVHRIQKCGDQKIDTWVNNLKRDVGRPKLNEVVLKFTFIYTPSFLRIDAHKFRLSC